MKLSEALDKAIEEGYNYCYLPCDDIYTASIHTVREKISKHGYFVLDSNPLWDFDPSQSVIRNKVRSRIFLVLFKESDTIFNIRMSKNPDAAARMS